MMYDFIMYDGSKEVPLYLKNYILKGDDPEEIGVNSPITNRHRYETLLTKVFNLYNSNYYGLYNLNFASINSTEGIILFGNDFLAIKTELGIEILFVRTIQNVYISKNIKSYKNLWKKIKVKITEILEGEEDVILTKNCGRNIFLQFEKPKFKSIQEREDYCNSLVEEVLPTKAPIEIQDFSEEDDRPF